QDVRTTVMIRNLPNRNVAMNVRLPPAVDAVSFGKYDFVYMRLDFERNLSVGCGFVNFIDAESIVPFLQHSQSRHWNQHIRRLLCFPPLLAACGHDCLVEKFRNSAIMDERPGYR
ncbi:hypothetical protein M409DRAFT_34099, partial [Zasmidium cellare ATCC 36951]